MQELFELPDGWSWSCMGHVADVIGGGTPKTGESRNYENGTIPWLTPADLSGYTSKYIEHGQRFITQEGLRSSSARMMPAGTVLFSSRAPVGYVVIAKNEICTNQGFKSFVLNSEVICSDYAYWWLKGAKGLAESMASGTTFLELSGAKAKKIPIPIAPMDQQKQIVEEIEKQFSRLDEAVANLKRVKANLKRYKASVLQAAVTGKLTEEWRKNNPDIEPASKLLERILTERRQKWEETELAKMRAKGLPAPKDGVWWLYVILCDDDSFYIGVTRDMPRRWSEHTGGKGAEWTKKHKPVLIIHHEKFCSQDDAYNREKELKTGFGRKWLKREYVNGRLRQAGKEPKNDKWKEKYKESAFPDVSNLPELPDGWVWESMGRVCEKITDGTHHSPLNTEAGEYKYVTAKNLKPWGLDLTNLTYVDEETHQQIYSRCDVKKDDVLYIKDGATTGLAVLNPLEEEFSLLSSVAVLRFSTGLYPKFFVHALNSPVVQDRMLSNVSGVAITRLTLSKLNESLIPIPSTEEQQAIIQEIESRLSITEEIERTVNANLLRTERLRQSILKQAFSGKLI